MSAPADRRLGYVPPPRPDWVAKVNDEGRCMDIAGVVPLDERSLIDTAMRNTGLSDFGEDDWREPFQVFIKALDEEAQLNLIGRLMTRSDILTFLEARLRIEDTYKRHPEINDQQIVAPLMVTGQGRSGTSALLNLLAADTDNGSTKIWETVFPCPPPEAETYATDPRIARADKLMTMWYRVTPEIQAIHEVDGNIPTETIHLDCLSFHSPYWMGLLGQVPSYFGYIVNRRTGQPYRYEQRVLRLLQWKNPRQRWVLKTPVFLQTMPEVLKHYPDARFVWIHRDPVVALSSLVNMVGTLNWIRSDKPFINDAYEGWTTAAPMAAMMSQPIDWLEGGVVPRSQLCNVMFRDFVQDPLAAVRQVYDYYGIDYGIDPGDARVAAMHQHLDEQRAKRHPRHSYDVGTAETIKRDREIFGRYQRYFGVPDEV